jgi:diadenosine tetraphosphate (Ap4A) HIT family hydrolase
MAACLFCDTEAGRNHCLQSFGLRIDLLARSRHFFVMPMPGAGTEGYLLVVSREHHHSMADLPLAQFEELTGLLGLLLPEVERAYGPIVLLEHGSTCHNISCMIDHAHIHIVPVPQGFSILGDIDKKYPMTEMRDMADLVFWGAGAHVAGDGGDGRHAGYLFYRDVDGRCFIHALVSVEGFEPQYMRKVLLLKLGMKEWDWRMNMDQGQVDDIGRRVGHVRDIIGRSEWGAEA